jgi:hypothetical protein
MRYLCVVDWVDLLIGQFSIAPYHRLGRRAGSRWRTGPAGPVPHRSRNLSQRHANDPAVIIPAGKVITQANGMLLIVADCNPDPLPETHVREHGIVRAVLSEEAMLLDGLPGYREYAAKVRFRV